MALIASVPPLRSRRRTVGTRAPTGAKMIAPSRGQGNASSDEPVHDAPRSSASFRCAALRVKTAS